MPKAFLIHDKFNDPLIVSRDAEDVSVSAFDSDTDSFAVTTFGRSAVQDLIAALQDALDELE